MDPVTAGMALKAAGPIVQVIGGLIAYHMSKGDREAARKLIEQAAAMDIPLPELEDVVAEQVGPSAFEDIRTDPNLRNAQMAALDRLLQIDQEGGLMLSDRANLNRIIGETTQAAQSNNAAVRENMAARGVGGSGAEIALQHANNQAAAQRAAKAGMDTAAMAQQRALDAIMARGSMAGNVRKQDFGEQAQAAQARDIISRYNADSRSRAAYHNSDLDQRRYTNQLRRAEIQKQGKKDMANWHQNEAQAKAQVVGGAANAAAYGAQGVGNYLDEDDD